MRVLLKVNMPIDTGNEAIRDGSLGETIQSILADLKPEAAYFGEEHGERTAFIFVDLPSAADIPRVCDPWFLAFEANVEIHPVMTAEDLASAGADIAAAVKKYG